MQSYKYAYQSGINSFIKETIVIFFKSDIFLYVFLRMPRFTEFYLVIYNVTFALRFNNHHSLLSHDFTSAYCCKRVILTTLPTQ